MPSNGVLTRIEDAIKDDDTPRWAVAILLCIRDDHVTLTQHLAMHRNIEGFMAKVAVVVAGAVAVAGVLWLMAGRFPGVFSP